MSELNFTAALLIILIISSIIGIKFYNNYKNNKKMSIDDFIDIYGDNIIKVLQDTIKVLSIDVNDYNSKDDYEKELCETTIYALKENSIAFGIPASIVNIIDTESLASIIVKVLNNNKLECFSILNGQIYDKRNVIIDDEIADVLTAAKEENPT